ncbi:odorant receptor 13a-like [Frieseomelitta varia]|uniref:odorant receptor 13a-like n=1 Tax=Frieseomelitta varia TaxID=561572 RepID=UPI001CB68FA6|nr:odorant receptor 13a-like [Frieseomelitta varia]
MAAVNTISPSVKFGLHCAGLLPGVRLSVLYKLYWVILFSIFHTQQYNYLIQNYEFHTFIEIIDNVGICLPFSLTYIKVFIVWTHQNLLRNILSTMEKDCQRYAVIDTNNVISKTAHWSYRSTTAIISISVIAPVFYAIGIFGSPEVSATSHRKLLFKMDFPFDTDTSPVFELVIFGQYLYHVSSAFVYSVLSGSLLMVVLHVGCQIDIICQTLMETPYESEKQLKFFISRHQEIIIFAQKIEKLFTYVALSQLVTNTLITCCLGYLMVISLRINSGFALFVKYVIVYVACALDAFLYCFAGEYLSTKSELLGDTAYKLLWYNIRPKETRLLIPVILRCQRGFTLTFGKFASLSMGSFTAIMKASGSYISVLLAMS